MDRVEYILVLVGGSANPAQNNFKKVRTKQKISRIKTEIPQLLLLLLSRQLCCLFQL
ncbi:hypothetical protein MAR_022895 [Mya arenaria]|uniref:Uncharacterized protein n=1 Tax=Mya arenaria TaxID=6604 RepID=A0ABY7DP73_MYAAR|nr:hypothetical protein MAR_022895 [Mya arenaria]